MGSKSGVIKVAAKKIGISLEEYIRLVDSGLKWCFKCKKWKPLEEFNKDSSRSSGYEAACRPCRSVRKTLGPIEHERRKQREKGFAWCRRCSDWLPFSEVKSGLCKKHHAEYARERYATNECYWKERRQHAKSKKRNIKPLPPEAQDILMEEFDGKCAYCGKPATSWDHIEPVSKGGDTTPGNVVPACLTCNSSKKTSDVIEWLDKKGIDPSILLYERMCLAFCGLYG